MYAVKEKMPRLRGRFWRNHVSERFVISITVELRPELLRIAHIRFFFAHLLRRRMIKKMS